MNTPGALTTRTLIRTYLRCYLVGASFNTRGLQTVGLALAMEPGLEILYPDPQARRHVWRRYLKIYNTHPFWTPFLVGVFLALEARIARRQFPDTMLDQVKSTVVYTLSAVGDSFFGGSLAVCWSLATACLLAAGQPWAAFLLGGALFAALNLFKLGTFILGYRHGFAALTRIRNWDLINWGRRIKVLNGALLVVLWALVWPRGMGPAAWALGVASVLALAFAAGRSRIPRELLVALAIVACLFFFWIHV
ncbi:PTS system mannose-specific EIID component [Fundidesulfovibrio magnetotacticus]|uniref:PTS system mannose-specific EIID component n=1 Tax=Fundidesulfovibrio magnetotacticus TaxID=2730080 RepID=A0A6V8LQJ8_9BACT|nr:PTS system mannose/fructose/sorbose family transporter subunit IID [Fundidesulfovibrio magnetotacticus]GFK93250.1 PTS system mannose-specific EIID component [Fundidesulfovibrio magnetotacticus]